MSVEWFARPRADGETGLRFSCTQCGNCCSGPEGYIHFSNEERARLAERLGITPDEFMASYTKKTPFGPSLKEKPSTHGLDCIFLDRETIPGRAICSVYEDRPTQCRTWPFWGSVVRSESSWRAASRTCPGIGKGTLVTVEEIRISRAKVDV